MTSLVICRGVKILNTNRPFDGDGVKMYVGGPDASDIQYRPNQIVSQNYAPLIYPTSNDVSVATVLSPNAEDTISYTLPAELVGEKLWYQLRTFKDDYENDSIFRPKRLETDDGGDGDDTIYGTAAVVGLQKLDGGGVRITFVWRPVRDGLQPDTFNVVKTSGTGTIADVEVSVLGSGEYSAEVEGLSDGVDYTFRIDAVNGAVTVALVSGIEFTGDSAGPPAVTNAAIEDA